MSLPQLGSGLISIDLEKGLKTMGEQAHGAFVVIGCVH